MATQVCPHCATTTGQRLIHQRAGKDLLWCQRCFHVYFDSWPFAVAFQPMHMHEALDVHVDVLNQDHVELMGVLNRLELARRANLSLADDFAYLLLLAGQHFRREEDVLKRMRYPGLAHHARRHAAVFADMLKAISGYAPTEPMASGDIIVALKCSLMDLLLDDMEYAAYLAGSGEVPARSRGLPADEELDFVD